jgi:hypothetical protein
MAASVAFMLVAELPTHGQQERIACSERPVSTREYWSWREIEGRRCWFVGRATIPKAMLYWRRESGSANPVDRGVRVSDRDVPSRADTRHTLGLGDDFPRRWQTLMQTFSPRSLLDPLPIWDWPQ